jgi:hypothetical protein
MDDTRYKSDETELERELSELGLSLDKLTVKYPGETEITATIDVLRAYVPAKPALVSAKAAERFPRFRRSRRVGFAAWRGLFRQAASDLGIVSRWYWLSSLLLFVLGCVYSLHSDADPYRTMALLAPVPVLTGILELFKSREQGVLEMELACRYSASQLLLSRLLLLIVYNIGLNILLTGCILIFTTAAVPGMLVLSWLTPLAVVTALSLWLAAMFRGGVLLTAGLTLWAAISLTVLSVPQAAALLDRINAGVCIMLIAASLVLGLLRLRKMADKYFLFETGERYAAGH